MSTNETRDRNSTVIIIAGDDVGVIDDTPDWEGPFTEYDCYSESTEYNYIQCPACGVEVFDGETSTASHRPVYRYE